MALTSYTRLRHDLSSSITTTTPQARVTKMPRSPSAEPTKTSKRKGTRSVSTLTPSQLARKRANDREAQRAIRARTKEHIERLERELEEVKGQHSRDETVKHLMKRNRMLERELQTMREKYEKVSGIPYAPPVYEDSVSSSSRGSTAFNNHQQTSEYNSPIPDYNQSYIPTTEGCDGWVAVPAGTVSSTVSSPTSTTANEEFGYIPSSMPPVLDHAGLPPTSVPIMKSAEVPYEGTDRSNGYPRSHPPHMGPNYVQNHPQQQQAWNMYPAGVYYHPQSPTI